MSAPDIVFAFLIALALGGALLIAWIERADRAERANRTSGPNGPPA